MYKSVYDVFSSVVIVTECFMNEVSNAHRNRPLIRSARASQARMNGCLKCPAYRNSERNVIIKENSVRVKATTWQCSPRSSGYKMMTRRLRVEVSRD